MADESLIQAVRDRIMRTDDRIVESVKWNAPSFATVEHFATFHLRSKNGLQVILHMGAKKRDDVTVRADVEDPDGLLEWRGDDRAVVTFRDVHDVEAKADAFTSIVRQWITHVR